MSVGAGTGYISSFPASKDDLSAYDVVFLGDVGIEPGRLSGQNAEMIKGLVEQQGSGLVFLPGIHGNEMSLISSPLGDLMPVVMDETQVSGFGSDMESHILLTEHGRGHLLTMLESDPPANEALWKRLPGFYWYAPVTKAKPDSDVLAVHSVARRDEERVPLLVTRNAGSGKVLSWARTLRGAGGAAWKTRTITVSGARWCAGWHISAISPTRREYVSSSARRRLAAAKGYSSTPPFSTGPGSLSTREPCARQFPGSAG
jgi:uncharacterized membrane protein